MQIPKPTDADKARFESLVPDNPRVTRPGGQMLVAWHGGSEPRRIQRRMILDESELVRIASAIEEHVGQVQRPRLVQSELFTAAVGAKRTT